MAQALYKVVVSGELAEDRDSDTVVQNLASLFKCSTDKAAGLVAGKPTKLKKEMSHDTAIKYRARLEKVGVKCSIEPAQELTLDSKQKRLPDPVSTKTLSLAPQTQIQSESLEPALKPIEEVSASDLLSGTTLSLEPIDNGTQVTPENNFSLQEASLQGASLQTAATVTQAAAQNGLSLSLDSVDSATVATPEEENKTKVELTNVIGAEPGLIVCPKCNTKQTQTKQCLKCGVFIEKYLASQVRQTQVITEEQEQSEEIDDMGEIALFVGEKFDDNYRLKFAEIHDNDDKYVRQWHWPSFLIPVPWMIHRKMYVWAGVFCILNIVIPSVLILAFHIGFGLAGNYLYFRFAKNSIAKINMSGMERKQAIAAKGDVLPVPIVIGITIGLSLLISVIFYSVFVKPEVEKIKQNYQKELLQIQKSSDSEAAMQVVTLKNIIVFKLSILKMGGKLETLPATIDELQEEIKILPQEFVDKWDNELDYEATDSGFILRSAGPDLEFNTEDDIVVEAALAK
ncbi:MAG: DUF2628 domain-containing protein [Gammaproteobacteria bacterium]|nr:DUF2628 domain-containing protein [Gammaproteobacteria bacterium]